MYVCMYIKPFDRFSLAFFFSCLLHSGMVHVFGFTVYCSLKTVVYCFWVCLKGVWQKFWKRCARGTRTHTGWNICILWCGLGLQMEEGCFQVYRYDLGDGRRWLKLVLNSEYHWIDGEERLILGQLGFQGRILSQEIYKKQLNIILNNNNYCWITMWWGMWCPNMCSHTVLGEWLNEIMYYILTEYYILKILIYF